MITELNTPVRNSTLASWRCAALGKELRPLCGASVHVHSALLTAKVISKKTVMPSGTRQGYWHWECRDTNQPEMPISSLTNANPHCGPFIPAKMTFLPARAAARAARMRLACWRRSWRLPVGVRRPGTSITTRSGGESGLAAASMAILLSPVLVTNDSKVKTCGVRPVAFATLSMIYCSELITRADVTLTGRLIAGNVLA